MFLIASSVIAQNKELDSIRAVIELHPKRDTTRVSIIMDYVISAVNENTTHLLPYLTEMISISKERNYSPGLQSAYLTAQIYYSDRGDFTTGILYADSAFNILNVDHSKKAIIKSAYLHHNLGGDYQKMGNYQQAIYHYTNAAAILEKYNSEVVANVYSGLAGVYEKLLQPDKAMEYDKKAIAVAEKSGNKTSILRRYLNLIVRYINQKNFDMAEEQLNKIEPMVMEVQQSFSMFMFHQNKGYVLQNKKKYGEAVSNFELANSYAKANDDKYQQIVILNPLSECLMDAGRMKDAKLFLDTLLIKSREYQMRFGELNAYAGLADWYERQGNYKSANDFLNKKMSLSDSISSDEMKEKIAIMETRFNLQGLDKEIKILQSEKQLHELSIRQKNILNYMLIGGAIIVVIISLLSYRNYRHKQNIQQQRITKLETLQKLTATEAVLKGEEQERTRLAKDLHDGLGGMLSGIKYSLNAMKGNLIMTPDNAQAFERSIDMLDSSIKEMRRVAHNMMPEALVKFGLDTALKDFCNDINQSGVLHVSYQSIGLGELSLSQTTAIAVYRIVQELLNNVMKHAAAKTVVVQASKTNDNISVTVEDDGKGFDPVILKGTKGMGWSNIQSRIAYLKGKLDVQSGPGKGTSVMIEFNV